jgi:MFS transporter, DHA1 family, multidrug resistance protein
VPDSRLSRLGLFVVLGCATAVGPASTDIYLPGMPALSSDLGVSQSGGQSTLTLFMIGMAVGQFLAGPLSDVHGRRRPLIAGMVAFTITSFACALAPNIWVLDGLRLVQGLAAAAGMAIGRAVVRDLYAGDAAAHYLSRLVLVVGLAPILAPVVGGQILTFTSWRGLFVALAIFGGAITLATFTLLPETLPSERRQEASVAETARTFRRLLADRAFLGYVLVGSLGVCAVVAYIAGSAFILEDIYGVSPTVYGVLYGVGALMMVIGAQINAHLLRAMSARRLLTVGMGIMLLAAALFLVVVPFRGAGVAVFMIPVCLLMLSWGFIPPDTIALALTDHPDVAGSASACLGASWFAIGALAAPLAGIGGNDTALPMAIVIAGCAVLAAFLLRALVPAAPGPKLEALPAEAVDAPTYT